MACAQRAAQPVIPEQASTVIFVGQPWVEAVAVAQRAGYDLENVSGLAMDPTPDGFYLNMPAKRGLIVYRNARENAVRSMESVENWPGPKKFRIYHAVQSFDLPAADQLHANPLQRTGPAGQTGVRNRSRAAVVFDGAS